MVRVAVPIMLEVVADCSDEERQVILRSQDTLDGGGAQHLSDTVQRINCGLPLNRGLLLHCRMHDIYYLLGSECTG